MIISGVEGKDVTITGNNNVQNMSMNVDEKAFSILIDKLYSRKSEAIIRELCSNACDAHIDAGIQHIPYDLTLPSMYGTELVVRDYGHGLSKDDVVYYLGTLFGSKSAKSNDAIGGFGLGAKSPFCLVDSYHITSYHEGQKHSFFYVREKGGIPKFVHLGSQPSTEKSGIKFTVDVGDTNMRGWASTAEKALCMFEVKPKCNLELNYPESTVYYDTVEVIKNYNSYDRIIACMGGVTYPVDVHAQDVLRLNDFYSRVNVSSDKIVLRFEIGELDVAPSREALEYTTRTIKSLNEKLGSLNAKVDTLKEKIKKDIVSNFTVQPYDKIFSTVPIKYFSVTSSTSMFTETELADHPEIEVLMKDARDIRYSILSEPMYFKRILRTLGNKGLTRNPRIVINNTSSSYKFISDHMGDVNIVKLVKKVNEKTALLFLTRICEYKFGKGNFTLEYFKDFADKLPKEVKERKSTTGHIQGVRDAYGDKIKKVDVDFDDDIIVYAVNDITHDKNKKYYSTSDIESLLKYAKFALGDDTVAMKVTASTEDRLKLTERDNAVLLFDYLNDVIADPNFINDMAHYKVNLAVSRHNKTPHDYTYSVHFVRALDNVRCGVSVTEETLDLYKSEIIKANRAILFRKFGNIDEIKPLDVIAKNRGYSYDNEHETLVDLILMDVVVDKNKIINNMIKKVEQYTVQHVKDML